MAQSKMQRIRSDNCGILLHVIQFPNPGPFQVRKDRGSHLHRDRGRDRNPCRPDDRLRDRRLPAIHRHHHPFLAIQLSGNARSCSSVNFC